MLERLKAGGLVWALPLLSLAGMHASDIARAVMVFGVAVALWIARRPDRPKPLWLPPPWYPAALAVAFTATLVASSIARVYLGRHGMDHAIFSQAVTSFVREGVFVVTHNRGWPNDYMLDHFSPILVLPAALVALGVPGHSAMIVAQAAAVAAAATGVWRLARRLGFDGRLAAAVPVLWLFSGDVRSQLNWGTQAEYLALPFVVFAFERCVAGKRWQAALIAFLAFASKETLMAWGAAFGLYAMLRERAVRLPYALLTLAGTLGFFTYTLGHAWLFGKSFDYASRIDVVGALTDGSLPRRLAYVAHFFVPVLLFPLLSPRRWIFVVPALPWFGMSLISNFPDMYEVNRQYVVLPATVVFAGALEAFATSAHGPRRVSWPVGIALVAAAFAWGDQKPTRALLDLWASDTLLRKEDLAPLLPEGPVYASSAAALFLLDRRDQLPLDRGRRPLAAGDRVILSQWDDRALLPEPARSSAVPCGESGGWKALCP